MLMTDEEWREMEEQGTRDLQEFERLLPSLLPDHLDEHVLIHRGRLIGIYPDYGAAADAGAAMSGGRGYFVERIFPEATKPILMIARPA